MGVQVCRDDGARRAHATQVVAGRRKAGYRREAGRLTEREQRSQVEED